MSSKLIFKRLLYVVFGAIVGTVSGAALLEFVLACLGRDDGLGVGLMVIASSGLVLIPGAIAGSVLAWALYSYLHSPDGAKLSPFKRHLLAAFMLAAPLAASSAMLWFAPGPFGPVPDSVLLSHFTEHEKGFTALGIMLKADRGVTLINSELLKQYQLPGPKFPASRLSTYNRLMHTLGVYFQSVGSPEDLSYEFTYSDSSHEASKGYVFLTKQPDCQVTDLDKQPAAGQNFAGFYRHIKGNWYIVRHYDDH